MKLLKILGLISVVFIIIVSCGLFFLNRGLEELQNVKVGAVNTSDINDGVYKGKYINGRWSNELSVTVKDHMIINIDIEDDVTFALPDLSEQLFKKVIEEQKTTVDVISEATVTSNAYLKSIENALSKIK